MKIIQVTTITLEDAEMGALQTLKDAYNALVLIIFLALNVRYISRMVAKTVVLECMPKKCY